MEFRIGVPFPVHRLDVVCIDVFHYEDACLGHVLRIHEFPEGSTGPPNGNGNFMPSRSGSFRELYTVFAQDARNASIIGAAAYPFNRVSVKIPPDCIHIARLKASP